MRNRLLATSFAALALTAAFAAPASAAVTVCYHVGAQLNGEGPILSDCQTVEP